MDTAGSYVCNSDVFRAVNVVSVVIRLSTEEFKDVPELECLTSVSTGYTRSLNPMLSLKEEAVEL